MKNIKIILILILGFLMPLNIYASEVTPDYEVKEAFVDAEIDIVGSLHVKEAIVVKGSLNGFKRIIDYRNSNLKDWEVGNIDFANSSFYNARGVSFKKASAKKIEPEEIGWSLLDGKFDEFKSETYANKGDEKVYVESDTSDGKDISIYNVNSDGYVVFFYEYYINQAVVLHNDVAEIYFNFFKLDADDVENVHVQLLTPGSSKEDVFNFWAHGALNGNISSIKDESTETEEVKLRGALAELEQYNKGDPVEIRMTFNKNLISPSVYSILNHSEQDALDSIVEVENKRIEDANRKRTLIKVIYYGTIAIAICYISGLIILWIYIYRKYDREYDVKFDHKYYREFTGDYNVEVVDYLMNKNISTNALSASIMNMICKHNIVIEELPEKNKKNLKLILKNRNSCNESEEKLLNLLFEKIGKDGSVTLTDIEKYSSKYETAEKFMKDYDDWKLSVTKDAEKEKFFEDYTSVKILASMYLILGLIVFILLIAFQIEYIILHLIVFIGSITFLIYVLSFKKWTRKGREHYLKWKAFKNFLLDFGSFKDKDIPEIILWDKYMVYATVLGIAKEVSKSMKVQLTNLGMDEELMLGNSIFYHNNFYVSMSLNQSLNNAHTQSVNVINAHNASSNFSSGSGGGFSSGGGFAGGGGGGGGF